MNPALAQRVEIRIDRLIVRAAYFGCTGVRIIDAADEPGTRRQLAAREDAVSAGRA